MAVLIPDYISPDWKSSAERRIFERFKKELNNSIIVLHSLGVARHRRKSFSELDFVVLSPEALLVIEVKGGRIKRHAGRWYFTNRYGEMTSKTESPMSQAASGAAALHDSMKEHFGSASPEARFPYGSATFFPDIPFKVEGPEMQPHQIFDIDALSSPMSAVIRSAVAWTRKEYIRHTGHQPPPPFTPVQLASICDYLRGDFEFSPSLSRVFESHEEEMIRLSVEQRRSVEAVAKNARILVEGGAGTGKTILAIESARRAATEKRVLYTCFNRFLAEAVADVVQREQFGNALTVSTLHAYCASLLKRAEIPVLAGVDDRTFCNKVLPEVLPKAITKVKDFTPFDYLVVDEGQDLRAWAPFVGLLSHLVKGGISGGNWIWFEDPNQRILTQGSAESFDLSPHVRCNFELRRNWRNTNEVAEFTCVASLTKLPPELSGVKGPAVRYTTLNATTPALLALNVEVRNALDAGIQPSDLVVLSVLSEKNALFAAGTRIAGLIPTPYKPGSKWQEGTIRCTSVFKFKGLESRAVIVVDIDNLKTLEKRMAAYVAMSRANSWLSVTLSQNALNDLQVNRLSFADLVKAPSVDPKPSKMV